jgi:hypothetical protein
MNKGTFTQGGGGNKDRSATRIQYRPNFGKSYLKEMLASQGGDKLSRPVSEAEEEAMYNQIANNRTRR